MKARSKSGFEVFVRPSPMPIPCGSYNAYRRHQTAKESPDDACREAYNAYMRKMSRLRRLARKEATTRGAALTIDPGEDGPFGSV